MTIKEKIEETKSAYEVLKPFINDEQYFAYLQGLLDAYDLTLNEDHK